MDRSKILTLIRRTYTDNEFGQKIPEETERDVFCALDSITRSEWAAAGQIGLKAELRATMFSYDYNGEEICSIEGKRYGIYRTYRVNEDTVELYLEAKAGLKNGNQY